MKDWWFKLYTLPFLKKCSLFFGVALLLDMLLSRSSFHFSFLVLFIPLLSFTLKITPGSFRQNLEFHKSHINFLDLRKYFIFDLIISILFLLLSSVLLWSISYFFGGSVSKSPANMLWGRPLGINVFYAFILSAILMWVGFISNDERYIFIGTKNRTPLRKFFLLMLIWVLWPLFIIVFGVFSFQVELSNFLLVASVCLGAIFFYLRAFFHLTRPVSTFFQILGYVFLGFFFLFFLYGLTFMIFENKLFDKDASFIERKNYLKFYAPLITSIDQELFLSLEKKISDSERLTLYSKVDFNPSRLGLRYFLSPSKNQHRLITFLRYGKPDMNFLESLFIDIEARPDFWQKTGTQSFILYLAFKRWPKNIKIPPSKLTLKMKADDYRKSLNHSRR